MPYNRTTWATAYFLCPILIDMPGPYQAMPALLLVSTRYHHALRGAQVQAVDRSNFCWFNFAYELSSYQLATEEAFDQLRYCGQLR
jgi:hypothetical protein